MKLLLATAFLFSSMTVQAATLVTTNRDDGKKIEKVAISKSGVVDVESSKVNVTTVGSGLRTKKKLFVNVKVYVAELLVSAPEKFSRSATVLESLDASEAVALRMSFLRTVDAETVEVSYHDGLVANGVNLNDPAIAAALKAIGQGGDAEEGKALVLVFKKNANGTETMVYEDTNGKTSIVRGNAGFTKSFLSIWLGVPADEQLGQLKKDLLSSN